MRLVLAVAACSLSACGRGEPPPAPPAPAAPVEPAAAATPAEPAAEPAPVVATVAAPVTPEGSPRKVVTGDGISITETSDGRVILKTTANWGEAIDSTYSDCSFYVAAIPVIERQIAPERAKLLGGVCEGAASKPAP